MSATEDVALRQRKIAVEDAHTDNKKPDTATTPPLGTLNGEQRNPRPICPAALRWQREDSIALCGVLVALFVVFCLVLLAVTTSENEPIPAAAPKDSVAEACHRIARKSGLQAGLVVDTQGWCACFSDQPERVIKIRGPLVRAPGADIRMATIDPPELPQECHWTSQRVWNQITVRTDSGNRTFAEGEAALLQFFQSVVREDRFIRCFGSVTE
jgi:hypothetical protein